MYKLGELPSNNLGVYIVKNKVRSVGVLGTAAISKSVSLVIARGRHYAGLCHAFLVFLVSCILIILCYVAHASLRYL